MMDSAVEDFMRGNLLPFIQSDRFDLSAVVANWQEVFLDIVEKDRAQLYPACLRHYISHVVRWLPLLTEPSTTSSWYFIPSVWGIHHQISASFLEILRLLSLFPPTFTCRSVRLREKGCAFVSCQWKRLPTLPAWVMPHRHHRKTVKVTWQTNKLCRHTVFSHHCKM